MKCNLFPNYLVEPRFVGRKKQKLNKNKKKCTFYLEVS